MTDSFHSFNDVITALENGAFDEKLALLYGEANIAKQKARYKRVADAFAALYGDAAEAGFFSAPGRTEIGGNHTDHNKGRVLAASVDLDAIAFAAKNDDNVVRIKSEGYNEDVTRLDELEPKAAEVGKSASLVRGVVAEFKRRGYNVGGFCASTASDVLSGSGVSSSAAFEVLVGTIMNHLYNDGKVDAVEIAQIAQAAENKFFGKPCGLMDQTACSVGSFVEIDFKDPSAPVIEKVEFDFASCGHSLCIVNTGGSHSDLTDEYAAVRGEMEKAAGVLGCKVLREVDEAEFMLKINEVRVECGDRAVLRALHFFGDNARVLDEAAALRAGDFEKFKALVIESGRSSYEYNQNVYAVRKPEDTAAQPVSVGLALCDKLLSGKGAWRVHGGGFAGTIQAFVPNDALDTFKSTMESVFGDGSCFVLSIRPVGGTRVY